jgi:cytochrome c5
MKKIILFFALFMIGFSLFADEGRSLYKSYCAQCHSTGSGGAPRVKDAKNWAPRLLKGNDLLIAHAYNGYNLMPPKGNCYDCTEQQIADAVNYMINVEVKKTS